MNFPTKFSFPRIERTDEPDPAVGCAWPKVFGVSNSLAALTVIAAGLILGGFYFNIVLRNYCAGGVAFLHHLNPYAATLGRGPTNQFKYSPLVALIFGFLAGTGPLMLCELIFKLVNYGLFFTGLFRWVKFPGNPFTLRPYVLAALFSTFADLIVSMSVNQVNAAVVGLMLIGLAEYREGRFGVSGFILMAATDLKVYPVLFLAGLALGFKRNYWVGAVLGGAVVFCVPAFFVGWEDNLQTHREWFELVLHDAGGLGILDIASAFERARLEGLGLFLRNLVLVCSIPVFFAAAPFLRGERWYFWMTFGLSALLLLSPRTELFTYVFLAPCYTFLAFWASRQGDKKIRFYLGPLVVLLSLMSSLCFFGPGDWTVSQEDYEIFRVLAALGLWVISGIGLVVLGFRSVKKSGSEAV